jgi:hypothetical protein
MNTDVTNPTQERVSLLPDGPGFRLLNMFREEGHMPQWEEALMPVVEMTLGAFYMLRGVEDAWVQREIISGEAFSAFVHRLLTLAEDDEAYARLISVLETPEILDKIEFRGGMPAESINILAGFLGFDFEGYYRALCASDFGVEEGSPEEVADLLEIIRSQYDFGAVFVEPILAYLESLRRLEQSSGVGGMIN